MSRLVRRHRGADGVDSSAWYSACETYRYDLTRVWDDRGRRLNIVMLNPSTATEAANDPTIERCQRRSARLGFGAMRITNIFALRETDPRVLRRHPAPGGPDNDAALREAADWADAILCAWGAHGAHRGAGEAAARLLARRGKPLFCLGTTQAGDPRHPLYVAYAQALLPWLPSAAGAQAATPSA